MQDVSLKQMIVDTCVKEIGASSYSIYYNGRPVLYNSKPLRIVNEHRGNYGTEFHTLVANKSGNASKVRKEFISSDDIMLNMLFKELQTNVIEFGHGNTEFSKYTFDNFASSNNWSVRDYQITILNSPKIIWVSSPMYRYLVETLSEYYPSKLWENTKFNDDDNKIRGNGINGFTRFINTLRCRLYKNYIDFISTSTFTRTFKNNKQFAMFNLEQTFSILSLRYVGDGCTIFNPVFDDLEIFNTLRNSNAFEKYFTIPEQDRLPRLNGYDAPQVKARLLEESVGDFRLIFMDNLSISKMLGLDYKFNFTHYTAAIFLMGQFVQNPFTQLMPEFANNTVMVYMLRGKEEEDLGYSRFIDVVEYNGLSDVEKSYYQVISALQMFVMSKWPIFTHMGFSDHKAVLNACNPSTNKGVIQHVDIK